MIKSMQLFVATTCILVFPTGLASDVAVQVAKQKNIKEPAISVYERENKKEQKDEIRLAKLSKITTTKTVEAPKKVENKKENIEEPKTETKQEEVIVVAKEEPATETKKVATNATNVTSRSSNSISSKQQTNTSSKKQTSTAKKTTNKTTTKKNTSTANKTTSTTNKSTNTTQNTSNTKQQTTNASKDWVWTGKKLTRSAGVVPAGQTPSGYKETYYNLNMNGCLKAMKLPASGMSVRADGVKTYNGYVMVASPNLKAHPKGSYIKTTLGMGYVVDFCPSGSLDIAVAW